MGKNENASKKTVQKQKQKIIDDKTFGLKNKNKSKKVQQQIQSIEKNVLNSGDPKVRKLEEERKKQKADMKLIKKAQQAEQDALFGEALLAIQKKQSGVNQKDGKIEAKGRDNNDDDNTNKKQTSAAMKMMYQMDAQEMDTKLKEDPNYVPTEEDEIEMERQKVLQVLKDQGNVGGTKVTPETFAIWIEQKKQKRINDIKKKMDIELKKKKGGKGLSILSGRDLYTYKKELFTKLDDDADDNVFVIPPTSSSTDNDNDNNDITNGAATSTTTATTTSDSTNTDDATRNNENENENEIVQRVQSNLFLQGSDDDLDDINDDDDDDDE